jgi:DNA/RNA endonuclease G (NUC1)
LFSSIPSKADLSQYLVSVRDIENETGIDFLHELPDNVNNLIEKTTWEIWPDDKIRPVRIED